MPAAAVRQRVQALFGITGRKGRVGGDVCLDVKALGLTGEEHRKLHYLSTRGDSGIPRVEVKFVDTGRNT